MIFNKKSSPYPGFETCIRNWLKPRNCFSKSCVSVLYLGSVLVAAVFARASQAMLLLGKDRLKAVYGRSLNAEYIDYEERLVNIIFFF